MEYWLTLALQHPNMLGSIPGCRKALCFKAEKHLFFFLLYTRFCISFHHNQLYLSPEMNEQRGVRARRQPERLHPGNHLKNLKKIKNVKNVKNPVIAEESESAESQERREYSDLDVLDGLFSGEIFLRTSYTQCNNGKTKRHPETLQVKFDRNSDSAESKDLSVGWLDLILSNSQALNHKIPPAVLNMFYASVSGHLIPAGSVERYRTHRTLHTPTHTHTHTHTHSTPHSRTHTHSLTHSLNPHTRTHTWGTCARS